MRGGTVEYSEIFYIAPNSGNVFTKSTSDLGRDASV